jgi:MATE family multidrug resistance protein
MGLSMVAEFGAFTVVTVACGFLGTTALAGHNVAITLASTTFQIPVAIGAAAAVRVGHAVGRGDVGGTRRSGIAAMGLGAAVMVATGLAFVTIPTPLARLITDQPTAIAAAVPLILVAAAFQLVDGLQAVGAGALRGAGDTRFAFLTNLAGHYLVGLPVGLTLAFAFDRGAPGLWWGLSAGLTAVGVTLTLRFLKLSEYSIARA